MVRSSSLGYLYAFGAALALSSSFIFSKSVLNEVSMIQFGFTWFSLGVLWNGAWYFGRKSYLKLTENRKQRIGVALLIAFFEASATGLFYLAIREMENPAVVSFIGNIGPVFVTFIGIIFLKERFNRMQIVGIVVTILGIFILNFRDGAFRGFLDPGAHFVILASLLFSLATITGRRFKQFLDPELMSFVRSIILASAFSILFFRSSGPLDFHWTIWKNITLGSFFETLLTIVFAYHALRTIEATRTSLIISSKAVWTLILAWIFLGVFPNSYQLIGGLMTMAGVYLITLYRGRLK